MNSATIPFAALKKHYCTVTASCEEAEEEKDDMFINNSNSSNESGSHDADLILETVYNYRKKWMKSALDQFCQRVCTPKKKK